MHGILSYGSHVPRHRLQLSEIGQALGGTGGRGSRTVAGYDEDTTSMAVEAARDALSGHDRSAIEQVMLATSVPAYLERANAAVVHAALQLPSTALALDHLGSMRAAAGALVAAARHRGDGALLAIFSDTRSGLPGSADEKLGADGASALLVGPGSDEWPVIAEFLGTASRTLEVFDRWRVPGDVSAHVWEERFAEGPLVAAGCDVLTDALTKADLTTGDVDHLVVVGMHDRAVRGVVAGCGVDRHAARYATAAGTAGSAGVAQIGYGLAEVFDHAEPGEVIAVVVIGDGAVGIVARTTEAIANHRNSVPIAQLRDGGRSVSYPTYLSWRGHLHREPPRRPDPQPPAAPPSFRDAVYKFGLVVGECSKCGVVNIPADRVCIRCHEVDSQVPRPLSEVRGVIVTYTIDHLAVSPSPPVISAVVDFDGGGRLICELTDVGPEEVEVGRPVRMTFRRLATSAGVHNYFWKARPEFLTAAVDPVAHVSTREPSTSR
jgi:hydroxymethylglutaryl-CoA synthase